MRDVDAGASPCGVASASEVPVDRRDAFTRFVAEVEPRLRTALCARFGRDEGREATADALAWAWEHWTRMEGLENPGGYLYRVATRRRFRSWRRPQPLPDLPTSDDRHVEPELGSALRSLTERQRTAVILIHGFEWTHREVAELMGISVPSVQKHQERALVHLQDALGVTADD